MPLKTIVSGYIKALGTATAATMYASKKEGIVKNPFSKKVIASKPAPARDTDLLDQIDDITNEDKNEFNDALNYLIALSDDDYDKMLKCVKVYREAEKKVSAIMDAPAPLDGEKVEVRIEKKDESSEFIETDDEKGKAKNAKSNKKVVAKS